MSSHSPLITSEHLKQFDEHGYFILPSVIPPEHVAMMKGVIERAIARRDSELTTTVLARDAIANDDGLLLCSADGKYFFFMHEDSEPDMNRVIFSTYIEQIVRAVLGDTVYYTHSEIVVKRGQSEKSTMGTTAFGWHQDSGYVPYQHTPYLSCWCALNEMTTTNGTLSVLPIERNPPADDNHRVRWYAKPRPLATTQFPSYQHRKDENNPDLVGYFGRDPGVEVLCPEGSIVVFSSLTLHCSSPNRSSALRSAFNVQYAAVPLMSEDQQSFRHKADPFIIQSETNDAVRKWQE